MAAGVNEEEGGADHFRHREQRGREKEGGTGLTQSQSRQAFWRDSIAPSSLAQLKATWRTMNGSSIMPQQLARLNQAKRLGTTGPT
jgi:hypothetical protein